MWRISRWLDLRARSRLTHVQLEHRKKWHQRAVGNLGLRVSDNPKQTPCNRQFLR